MQSRRKNNKAGFTLVETLLVVGILIAVLSLSVVGVSRYIGDLRQREMDSKAEIIYAAAQNRLALLRANGMQQKYQPGALDEVITAEPVDLSDYNLNVILHSVSSDEKTSADSAAAMVLPENSVEHSLWENDWVIEYNASTGSVYAVFYSESGAIPSQEERNALRLQYNRRNKGGNIGYYGGDVSLDDQVLALDPQVQILNGEELRAVLSCRSPDGSRLAFSVVLTNADGVSKTISISQSDLVCLDGRTYEYVMVLDSLKDGQGFMQQHLDLVTYSSSAISVKLVVSSPDNTLIQPSDKTAYTNAFFADSSSGDTAVIECGRHLQNLNSFYILGAVQSKDISFRDDPSNDFDWYDIYGSKTFEPIRNGMLSSFDGAEKTIHGLTIDSAYSDTGLFASMYDCTLKNIRLSGARLKGNTNKGFVGALLGVVLGKVEIQNCWVYLDEREGDLFTKEEDVFWTENDSFMLQGYNVGGLVGGINTSSSAELTITNSFAATTIQANYNAGGLVGSINRDVGVTLQNSYADCYIKGAYTAGLVTTTSASVTIKNCYAAGYQNATLGAAGLVMGEGGAGATVSDSYTACVYYLADVEGNANFKIHAFVQKGQIVSGTKAYYLKATIPETITVTNVAGAEAKGFEELCAAELPGFVKDSAGNSYAYNLLDQHLTDYSFPRLAQLPHYGDWKAEFVAGGIAYYEVYQDDSVSFAANNGGNLQDEKSIVLDGYGLIFESQLSADLTYTLNGESHTLEISEVTPRKSTLDGQDYYIYPLPVDLLKDLPADGFYYSLEINDKTEYFNPHFAHAVSTGDNEGKAPEIVYLRTARQLYLLSQHYSKYQKVTNGEVLFWQELDIDYASYSWTQYYDSDITQQAPIGYDAESGTVTEFIDQYNGDGHTISGVDISAKAEYIGLFGWVSNTVENVVLRSGSGNSVHYDGGISGQEVSIGALAGRNDGLLYNCAVSGYSTQLNAYTGSTVFLGGLVGYNGNQGEILHCSVSSIGTTVNVDRSEAYIGGFVGKNQGASGGTGAKIIRCYAIGAYQVIYSKSSDVILAGFAGQNNMGTIQNCYCASALSVSGTAQTAAFAPKGGMVSGCVYLENGSYYLEDTLYAFQCDPEDTDGTSVSYSTLQGGLSDYGTAEGYPFPAIVKKEATYVHYGTWPEPVELANFGIFYWEKETNGANAGVHISYIDIQGNRGSNLCSLHGDDGIIESFGYGYFVKAGKEVVVQFGGTVAELFAIDETVNQVLEEQMPGYKFVAVISGGGADGLRPGEKTQNIVCTITAGGTTGGEYSFTISPFFADAMQYSGWTKPEGWLGKDYSQVPGSEANPYNVRSAMQLQLINWNATQGYSYYVQSDADSNAADFNYLSYTIAGGTSDSSRGKCYWVQTHDIDFDLDPGTTTEETFTPIGSMFDSTTGIAESNVTAAYFAGSYDGGEYIIQNLEIKSDADCVGLFGITIGAELRNISLYSDRGNIIQVTGGSNAYFLGGLAGFAAKGSDAAVIHNCTVAGYHIRDTRTTHGDQIGANIGGLLGATNVDVEGCTAVTDIEIASQYNMGAFDSFVNVRAGGLVGSLRGTISNCYTGGSVISHIQGKPVDPESHFTGWDLFSAHPNLFIGGISGGITLRTATAFQTLMGQTVAEPEIRNSYSFVDLPEDKLNMIWRVASIGTIGEWADTRYGNISGGASMNLSIVNCYALADAVSKSEDYENHKDQTDWANGPVTLSPVGDNLSTEHTVTITNPQNPYLSYKDMEDGTLLELLGTAFAPVTTVENGATVYGKYSYPAGDPNLQGRDFPFPTVLTREGGVHVHFGTWPEPDIYWEQSELEMDLLADAEKKIVIHLRPGAAALEPEDLLFSYSGEAATVTAVEKVDDTLVITLKPQKAGIVIITPKLQDASEDLSAGSLFVRVTAQVIIQVDPNPMELLEDEQAKVVLTAVNKYGAPLAATKLDWKILDMVDRTVAEHTWTKQTSGSQLVPVTGFTAGQTCFLANVIYDNNYVGETLVTVRVKDTGVVGLSDGKTMPYQLQVPGGAADTVQEVISLPNATFLLYADCGIEQFAIRRIKVDSTELTADQYTLHPVRRDGVYSYLPLTLSDSITGNVHLSVELYRDQQTYVLELDTFVPKQFQITLDRNNETGTFGQMVAIEDEPLGYLETPTYRVSVTYQNVTYTWEHIFAGWVDENGNQVTSDTVLSEDTILTAQWNYNVMWIQDGSAREVALPESRKFTGIGVSSGDFGDIIDGNDPDNPLSSSEYAIKYELTTGGLGWNLYIYRDTGLEKLIIHVN